MSYKCAVCGKSVTPAAYAYCVKNEYPTLCHKHQQEKGVNRYNVHTTEEIEAGREIRAEEKAEQANKTTEEKREISVNRIKHLSYKMRSGELHKTYKEAFKREIELGKEFFTEEELTKLQSCYNKFANLTETDGRRIKKENESKVEAAVKELGKQYAKNGKGFKLGMSVVTEDVEKITSKYPIDTKLNEWLYSLITDEINQELSEGFSQYSIDNQGIESLEIY